MTDHIYLTVDYAFTVKLYEDHVKYSNMVDAWIKENMPNAVIKGKRMNPCWIEALREEMINISSHFPNMKLIVHGKDKANTDLWTLTAENGSIL